MDFSCFLSGIIRICIEPVLLFFWWKKKRARLFPALAALIVCFPVFMIANGIRNGFGFWQFFARFLILFWGQKVFDIAVFDWFLLCHSGFYPHYFPEIREVVGPHLFGYNWKSHLIEIISHLIVSALLSVICMRKSPLSGREESSVTAC